MFNLKLQFNLILFSFLAVQGIYSTIAYAYPENIRHGYVNCTTCHVSPSGGGILTEYGRELSKDVQSTWGRDGEGKFAYGLVKLPEWISLGGDVRGLQLIQSTPAEYSGQFIWMQADIEAAFRFKQWTLVGTFGKTPDIFLSRRHYLIYQLNDSFAFRAGRYFSAFGLNIPEHVALTRKVLGYDQELETYNIEASWIDEFKSIYVTGVLGRPDDASLNREQGVSVLAQFPLGEKYKIGFQYLYGKNNSRTRNLLGIHALLGFTPHFYYLSELDFTQQTPNTSTTWGLVNYQKLGYEVLQGLHLYLTQESSRQDFTNATNQVTRYGFGTQWFPRPHIEANFVFMKQLDVNRFSSYTDLVWLLFHFYF